MDFLKSDIKALPCRFCGAMIQSVWVCPRGQNYFCSEECLDKFPIKRSRVDDIKSENSFSSTN